MNGFEPLFGIALRVVISYFFILVMMRLTGKREFGQIAPEDFITSVILGDLFDDIFWAEVPLANGIAAISALCVLHASTSFAAHRSRG